MFVAAATTALLALSTVAEAARPKHDNPLKRALPASGCTCNGQTAPSSSEALFYPYTTNGKGWCFESGVLMADWQAEVLSGLESGVANTYINAPVALQVCTDNGITNNDAACADYLIQQFTTAILGSAGTSKTYLTTCEYPYDSWWYTMVDCQCTITCNEGYLRCGDSCFDPTGWECVSGSVEESVQIVRRGLPVCPAGLEACGTTTGSAGWECLDISADIEACGGCPGTEWATDCTSLPGVASVSCRQAKCVVGGCSRGWKLVNGECVKLH